MTAARCWAGLSAKCPSDPVRATTSGECCSCEEDERFRRGGRVSRRGEESLLKGVKTVWTVVVDEIEVDELERDDVNSSDSTSTIGSELDSTSLRRSSS